MTKTVFFLIGLATIGNFSWADDSSSLREPAAAAAPVIPSGSGALKFSGFFDLRYSTYSAGLTTTNDHAESGFGLEDGALYINYDKNKFAMVVDINVRRAKTKDFPGGTAPADASDGPNVILGWDRSQIYARYKLSDSFVLDLGQFDTIFGVELNDSKDRFFGRTGLVYDQTLPVTHMGFMAEYLNNGFYGKLFAANPSNKGTNGVSSKGDESTEYGGAFGYTGESVRGQAGYMARPITTVKGSRGDRSLLDATFGLTFGSFMADFEYSIVTDPSKSTLTTDATDSENAGTGFLALLQYKFGEALSLGVRFETIDSDPNNASIKKADALGVSAHHQLAPELQLRSEFIEYHYTPVAGEKYNDQRFNVAALAMF